MIRQNIAVANRRAAVAIVVAVVVVAIAVVGGAYYLIAGRTLDDTEVVAQMKPTVVRILVGLPGGGYSSGTGWVLDANKGLIVTNGHVIDAGQSFQVQADGIAQRNANVVAAAPCDDIAVIHVDDKAGLVTAKVGSQENLKQGERVWALGFPKTSSNESPLVANGGNVSVVKAPYAESREADLQGLPNMILSTAEINHGNSGGPLVTQKLEVVGMNTRSSIDPSRAEYWAIGIDRISALKDRLVNGQGIGYTGLSFIVPTYKNLADAGFKPENYGTLLVDAANNPVLDQQGNKVLISKVVMTVGAIKGSQAELLGLNGNLVVTKIDGHEVNSLIGICQLTGGRASGDKSTFSLVFSTQDRNGRAVEVDLPYD
jgi:S1-C subfamily serine protease